MIFFALFELQEWESDQFLNFVALQQIFKNRPDFEQPSDFLMKSGTSDIKMKRRGYSQMSDFLKSIMSRYFVTQKVPADF